MEGHRPGQDRISHACFWGLFADWRGVLADPLKVHRRRVLCDQCGDTRPEKLSRLGRCQGLTDRLAEAVNQLLVSSNILAVARFFQLGWHTVRSLDKALLRQPVHAQDCSLAHYLVMDEFAPH